MKTIGWGMIGCGDVTQVKSGPAFNKVPSSFIAAVMSRNLDKAKAYAHNNSIAHFYDDAKMLLANPGVNAVYIATPPSTHEQYALMAFEAGKDVYIEKPMALNHASALRIAQAAKDAGVKLVVAHYRREQAMFKQVKQMIDDGKIGEIRLAVCNYEKHIQSEKELQMPGNKWRVDPLISGGGIFHDLAPHQLDLMLYFLGPYTSSTGFSGNQTKLYPADDVVCGNILFANGAIFHGTWLFNSERYVDEIVITGTKGKISFAVFQHQKFSITAEGLTENYTFDLLPHVQMPLIHQVVKYFQGSTENPCDPQNGVDVMKIMDSFTRKPI